MPSGNFSIPSAPTIGPVAHLVERRFCIPKVSGSSPLGSTTLLSMKVIHRRSCGFLLYNKITCGEAAIINLIKVEDLNIDFIKPWLIGMQ